MTAAKEINILIADDDPDLLEAISDVFRFFGFGVLSASETEQAWQQLSSNSVDIVITDIRMPGGGGLELLKRIKDRNVNFPKVLFVSGFSDYSEEELYDSGVDGFFAKPFDSGAVRNAIRKSLLRPEDRWKVVPHSQISGEVSKKVSSLTEAQKNGEVSFGRGGLFIGTKFTPPTENEMISFDIQVGDKAPVARIQGIGRVRWLRMENESSLPRGIGVEIEYLEDSSRNATANWLSTLKIKSYIPRD